MGLNAIIAGITWNWGCGKNMRGRNVNNLLFSNYRINYSQYRDKSPISSYYAWGDYKARDDLQ